MSAYKEKILTLFDNKFDADKSKKFTPYEYINTFRQGRKLCLFGAGGIGLSTYYRLQHAGIDVDFFCDNSLEKIGKEIIDGVYCVSPQELFEKYNDVAVIISVGDGKDIAKQVLDGGIKDALHCAAPTIVHYGEALHTMSKAELRSRIDQLISIVTEPQSLEIIELTLSYALNTLHGETKGFEYESVYTPNQYFPRDISALRNNSVFVDCGAFDGDTLHEVFATELGDKIKHYHAYELDSFNFARMNNRVEKLPIDIQKKITLHETGVSDIEEDIYYAPTGSDTFMDKGGVGKKDMHKAKLVALSDDLVSTQVDFIKMDIEGAEPLALKGAASLIKKYRPTLAICTYHSLAHLWEIPLYIKSLVPEYSIRFRHHTKSMFETVCYATVEG